MNIIRDLSNIRFGNLVVDDIAYEENGNVYWNCKCDCGNDKISESKLLTSGHVKSCGCLKHKKRYINLTNCTFGRLYVIGLSDIIDRLAYWLCKCSCEKGNIVIVRGSNLRNGTTKSCGCLSAEMSVQRNRDRKSENIYDLSGEYGIGFDSKGLKFYFDLEDYEKIKIYKWYVSNANYVMSSFLPTGSKKGGKISLFMHRIVTNCLDEKLAIDHINHDRTDNRKENLRIVNYSQNGQNKYNKVDTSSGRRGVSWSKTAKKWDCYISIEGKRIKLGYYDSLDEAIKIREDAEIKYFGEYRYKQEEDVING
jgi:hypothetical protein